MWADVLAGKVVPAPSSTLPAPPLDHTGGRVSPPQWPPHLTMLRCPIVELV
jgi:hypothetical protein